VRPVVAEFYCHKSVVAAEEISVKISGVVDVMATEIERKFLVIGEQWRAQVRRSRDIRQGYVVDGNDISVRVRIYDDAAATLTLKSERQGIRRSEFEYPIPSNDGKLLLQFSRGRTIQKVRHEVPADGLLWEIDVFGEDNEGLVLAEIELKSTNQSFERPQWIGAEVTQDQRFYNSNLSRRPFRSWRGEL
jgi:adenylate cyclase